MFQLPGEMDVKKGGQADPVDESRSRNRLSYYSKLRTVRDLTIVIYASDSLYVPVV
jgi:hypothetical protein